MRSRRQAARLWTIAELVIYLVLLGALFAAGKVVFGQEPKPPLEPVKLALDVDRITDGETVFGTLHNPAWGLGNLTFNFRVLGYHAWGTKPAEVRGRTPELPPEEVKRGKAAMRALREVLDMGQPYAEPVGKIDHARHVASIRVWVKTETGELIDVAAWMRRKGHAKPEKPDSGSLPPRQTVKYAAKTARSGKLDQLATAGLGMQAQGTGFGGYSPSCQLTRAASVAEYQRRSVPSRR